MNKVFDIDFRKGTLIDSVTGEVGVLNVYTGGTLPVLQTVDKGIALHRKDLSFNCLFENVDTYKSNLTLIAWVKYLNGTTYTACLSNKKTAADGINIITQSNVLKSLIGDGTNFSYETSGYTLTEGEFYQLVVSYEDGGTLRFYVNGVLVQTVTSSITSLGFDTSLKVNAGGFYQGKATINSYGDLYRAQIYDGVLGIKEIVADYNNFLRSAPVSRDIATPLDYGKSNTDNESGIVAHWNFIPSGSTLVDTSGNGNNGTITSAMSTKDGMYFDGSSSKVVVGNIGNVRMVVMRMKFNSTSEKILEGAANDKLIYSSSGTLSYTDFDNAYVDGVDSDSIVAGKWHNIVITSSSDVSFSALTIGLNNTTYGNFEIAECAMYSSVWTEAQIQSDHNKWAKRIVQDREFEAVGSII